MTVVLSPAKGLYMGLDNVIALEGITSWVVNCKVCPEAG